MKVIPLMIELILFLALSTFTPGPNNLISMHLAIQASMKAVLKYVAGTFFGFLIVLNLTGFGHLLLSQKMPQIADIIKYVGFAFMLFLAYKIVKHSAPIANEQPPNVNWFHGFTLQFLNPKIWLAGLTVFSVYIFDYSREPYIIFLTAISMSFIGVVSQLTWAIVGLAIRRYYNSHYKFINGLMSMMLVYLAFSILH